MQTADIFIGRADELAHVAAVVGAARLVTLVGGPGIGKTTLASEVVRDAADTEIIRLAETAAGAPPGPVIAAALGVREQPGSLVLDTLTIALAGRDVTLVLDGAERVRDALAPIVERLLLDCPRLRLLVTSQVPLHVRGEVVITVAPLDEMAAIALAQHHAGDACAPDDVAAVVRRLDGNPLALVLAARALASAVAPAAVRAPGDDAVTGAIAAAIERLPDAHRELLAFLAALPAGAPGDVLDAGLTDDLVASGLVVVRTALPVSRYRVAEAVSDVATEALSEAEHTAAALRRASWLESVVGAHRTVRSPSDEKAWLDAVERELANIASALTWACAEGNEADGGALLAATFARVALARARFDEGARLVDIARRTDTAHSGRLAYLAGGIAQLAGRLADARVAFEEAEARGRADGDEAVTALGLLGRASIGFLTGDRAGASTLVAEARERAVRSGDDTASLNAASLRGMLARITGDLAEAERAYAEAIAIARRVADHRSLATALLGHGSVAQLHGALDDAQGSFVEARAVAAAAGHPAQLAAALGSLGVLADARGQLDESRRLLRESVDAARAAGEHRTQLETLANLGACEIELADYKAARAHLGDALGLARRLADRRVAAFALAGLAECALAEDDVAAAARLERESLISRRDLGDRRALALGLEETAEIAARAQHTEDVELLVAGADAIRAWAGLARSPSEAARVERLAQATAAAGTSPRDVTIPGTVDTALRVLDAIAGTAAAVLPPAEDEVPSSAPLRVRTLGGFGVEVAGAPVPNDAWGSRRARQLVKMLVAARGQPVARDRLIAALWPDAKPDEEERLGARLSVLLSTARKVMGGAGIEGDRAALAIDLGAVEVDVEQLFAAVTTDRLDEAVARYRGDFLPEDVYEEWSTALREQARLAFLGAARRLARASASSGDHERAAALCLRTLDADPYDDDAHRLLVGSLIAAGRSGEAARAYQLYAARMNELGVEPAPFSALTGRAMT